MRHPALAAAILAASLAGCATAGLRQLESDLDALQEQVWKLQKDGTALADQVRAGATAGLPAAGGSDTTAALAEIRARLGAIEREIATLRTRADDGESRIETLAGEVRAAREAMAAPPAAPTGAAAPTAGSPEPAAALPPAPAALGPGSPDLYRQAYAEYARGNYPAAIQGLEEFLARNPPAERVGDALFLLGEARFAGGQYDEAIAAYDRLLQSGPAGERAAAAHLKKGFALLEINRTAEAVIQLQHVISAFPKSDEARMARDRLRTLGLKDR